MKLFTYAYFTTIAIGLSLFSASLTLAAEEEKDNQRVLSASSQSQLRRDTGAVVSKGPKDPDIHKSRSFKGKNQQWLIDNLDELALVEGLELGFDSLTDKGLEQLGGLPNLQRLDLPPRSFYPDAVTDAGLQHLSALPQLLKLRLDADGSMNITDEGFRHVSALHNLQELIVSGSKITDAGLQHTSTLLNLQKFMLYDSRITGAGLQHLIPLPNIRSLELSRCYYLTDANLRYVGDLTNLEHLEVTHCRNITGDGLRYMGTLSKLRALSLCHSNIRPLSKLTMEAPSYRYRQSS